MSNTSKTGNRFFIIILSLLLIFSTMISPLSVYADKATAPGITLPADLEGAAECPLKDVNLPDGWSWVDPTTVMTTNVSQYPARLTVDDENYDYTSVEGYNAEGHYVERNVDVTVTEMEIYSVRGNVLVNIRNFPDERFRTYISDNFDKEEYSGELTESERERHTAINLEAHASSVYNLKGIEWLPSVTELWLESGGITELNLENNTALIELHCEGSNITSLNLGNNTVLERLDCYWSDITELNLEKNTALTYLYCYNTGITKLNLENNKALKSLSCNNTGITELNLENNTALERLGCSNTGITELNLENNTALKSLNFSNTGITELNLENNTALEHLDCNNTGISGLDLSKCNDLNYIDISDTPIAYLNVGDSATSLTIVPSSTPANVAPGADSFKMQDMYDGIIIDKISEVQGATYNESTGEMSGYTVGSTISYTYDCGTRNGVPKTIQVTLNVSQADNSWTTEPSIKDWKYESKASEPTAVPQYGTTTFTYSSKENGTFTNDKPTTVGTWYMKATVDENDYHKGLSKTVSFKIEPKGAESIVVPDITEDTDLDKLEIKDGNRILVKGTDYDITETKNGNTVTVVITFKGNYSGSITKSYVITENKNNVKTGDNSDIELWLFLILITLVPLSYLNMKRKENSSNN